MKSQFWSIDLMFAIFIFSIAITLLAFAWFGVNRQFGQSYGYGIESMQAQLQSLQERILYTGSPANWTSIVNVSGVSTWNQTELGLGSSSTASIVSTQKIMMLSAMANTNYQDTKPLLGIGYDYFIIISTPGAYNITIGSNPYTHSATSVQVTSFPILLDNGVGANMKLMVWTNTSFGVG